MADTGRPLSRQPSCALCDHEEHVFTRCHSELTRSPAYVEVDDDEQSIPLLCPCPPRRPNGIYD